jgi:lactoylglutathione lyase
MARLPRKFEELVQRLPELAVGGLASAESPPASAPAVRAAQTLEGSLLGAAQQVACALEYIVLRCRDLERARAFYEAVGLHPVREKHGQGAEHYACAIGGAVVERYPLSQKPTSGVRLGLRVPSVAAAVESVRRLGGQVVRLTNDGPSPSAMVLDFDGHEISLSEQKSPQHSEGQEVAARSSANV